MLCDSWPHLPRTTGEMEQPFVLCDEDDEPEPQPQRSRQEPSQVHDEDAELIFVGVEHVNEDAELIFVGMTSNSKPATSNILNRVTPGSRLKRKHDQLGKAAIPRPQSSSPAAPTSESVIVVSASPAASRSTESPIVIEPVSRPESHSPQVVPSRSSECRSPLPTLWRSKHSPGRVALSVGEVNERLGVSKCHSASEGNIVNPQRPERSVEIVEERSSALSPSGTSHHTSSPQLVTPS